MRTATIGMLLAGWSAAVLAQNDDEAFFTGASLSYIVATNAGGGYDAYARLIGPYLERHLPVDHIVIRNVPGAGHLVGANTLARSRPDGLTIGTFNAGLIYAQLAGNTALGIDLREYAWIGKAAGEPRAVITSARCAITSIDDLLAATVPVVFAGAGIGSASYAETVLLAEALDLNVRIIPGYEGTETEMAMLRGEICGLVASMSSVQSFVDAGNGQFILTIGGERTDFPVAIDYARTPQGRSLVRLIETMAELGRVSAAPPDTPSGRLAILRNAYRAALEDADFVREAERRRRPIEPAYGDDVGVLFDAALNQPPEIVALIAELLRPQH